MKYYLDTEFFEDGPDHPIRLISIGIVAEDDREYYAVCADGWDESQVSDWLKVNVLPHLDGPRKSRRVIAQEIIEFIGGDTNPEFWAHYADYDWVVFCQLFGRMIDLPKNLPMFCMDVKQLASSLGNPKLPKQRESEEHNALFDALDTRRKHRFLLEMTQGSRRLANGTNSNH